MADGRGLEDLGVPDNEIAKILQGEEEVLATGSWCLVCGFLEDEEDIQDNKCMSCGCDGPSHCKAKVVVVN